MTNNRTRTKQKIHDANRERYERATAAIIPDLLLFQRDTGMTPEAVLYIFATALSNGIVTKEVLERWDDKVTKMANLYEQTAGLRREGV